MRTKKEIQQIFQTLYLQLPGIFRLQTQIIYDVENTAHGTIDVVLVKDGECMAIGRFRELENKQEAFVNRFNLAMGFEGEPWFLFDFDGEKIAYNDLNVTIPQEEVKTMNLAVMLSLFKKPYGNLY